MIYNTPTGRTSALYDHIAKQTHVLIAGTTGSGKSVVTRGILNSLLYNPFCDSSGSVEFILIDPKGTELVDFSKSPHCLRYASAASDGDMLSALRLASAIVDKRFSDMQADPALMDDRHYYIGSDLWVVIDELADLMLSPSAAEVKKLLQHIGQIGRAARVHMLACTQCPLVKVIPTEIKVNFDAILALRTRSAQDSRNIIGIKGAETFPKVGKAMYQNPDDPETVIVNLPFVDDTETKRLVEHWRAQLSKRDLKEHEEMQHEMHNVPCECTGSRNKGFKGENDIITTLKRKALKWACVWLGMIAILQHIA